MFFKRLKEHEKRLAELEYKIFEREEALLKKEEELSKREEKLKRQEERFFSNIRKSKSAESMPKEKANLIQFLKEHGGDFKEGAHSINIIINDYIKKFEYEQFSFLLKKYLEIAGELIRVTIAGESDNISFIKKY